MQHALHALQTRALPTGDRAGEFSREQLKTRVLAAIEHWTAVANDHGRRHGLPFVAVLPCTFDLRGGTAGMFVRPTIPSRHKSGRYRINADLLQRYPVEIIRQTVPHEVAHAVTRAWFPTASSHGKEWRFVMEKLFAKPAERCHSMVVSRTTMSFVYVCACAGFEHAITSRPHNKIQNSRGKLRCRRCAQELSFTGRAIRPQA